MVLFKLKDANILLQLDLIRATVTIVSPTTTRGTSGDYELSARGNSKLCHRGWFVGVRRAGRQEKAVLHNGEDSVEIAKREGCW